MPHVVQNPPAGQSPNLGISPWLDRSFQVAKAPYWAEATHIGLKPAANPHRKKTSSCLKPLPGWAKEMLGRNFQLVKPHLVQTPRYAEGPQWAKVSCWPKPQVVQMLLHGEMPLHGHKPHVVQKPLTDQSCMLGKAPWWCTTSFCQKSYIGQKPHAGQKDLIGQRSHFRSLYNFMWNVTSMEE